MTKRKYYQTLKFWIWIIIFILLLSNIGISVLKPDWNTKIGLFISLNASILGGLCTLISVSITNNYYNREKIMEQHNQQIQKIYKKMQLLQFLSDEFDENKVKYDEYNKPTKERFVFQSVVWEEYRKEFIEIFMNKSITNLLTRLQYFYSQIRLYDNVFMPNSAKVFIENYENLTNDLVNTYRIYEAVKADLVKK